MRGFVGVYVKLSFPAGDLSSLWMKRFSYENVGARHQREIDEAAVVVAVGVPLIHPCRSMLYGCVQMTYIAVIII